MKKLVSNIIPWPYIVVCLVSLFIGVAWLLVSREILVLHWAGLYKQNIITNKQIDAISRKNVILWYWSHEALAQEPMTIIWHQYDAQENLKTVAQRWLQCMQDENLISAAITLQTVAISLFNQDGILSFSGPILKDQYAIYQKWHIIESLCKTIRQAGIVLQGLQILDNQATMKDDHLDFSRPWSIHGYLTE